MLFVKRRYKEAKKVPVAVAKRDREVRFTDKGVLKTASDLDVWILFRYHTNLRAHHEYS